MRALLFGLLLLIIVPAVEIATFIHVGARIGALPTILLTLFTAALGIWLVRLQGFMALTDFHRAMREGREPFTAMLAGGLLLLAGLLLLIPGFVTDAIGFVLLIPSVRQWLARQVAAILFRPPPPGTGSVHVIEAEVVEIRDPSPPRDLPPRH